MEFVDGGCLFQSEALVIQQTAPTAAAATSFGWVLDVTTLSALAAGGWAIFQYIQERRRDRAQRVAELEQRTAEQRWREIKAAKDLLDELLNDAAARVALRMLDSWSQTYEVAPGVQRVIAVEDWLAALATAPDRATDPVGTFVRESFDALFYRMAILEHYIANGFVKFHDVVFPLEYYAMLLGEDKAVHERYLTSFHMPKARVFLERFAEWNHPSDSPLQSSTSGTQPPQST